MVVGLVLLALVGMGAGYWWSLRQSGSPPPSRETMSQEELDNRQIDWQVESKFPGIDIKETKETEAWFVQAMAALKYPPGMPVLTYEGSLEKTQVTYPDTIKFVFVPLSQLPSGEQGRMYETTVSNGELMRGYSSTSDGSTAIFFVYL